MASSLAENEFSVVAYYKYNPHKKGLIKFIECVNNKIVYLRSHLCVSDRALLV